MKKNLHIDILMKLVLGIDFTARDIQNECKKNGLPWEKAKSFDGSAKISSKFINKSKIDIFNLNFSLKKNNLIVQKGNSCDMIFNYHKIISYISKFCTLKIGDLIFTGTPSRSWKSECWRYFRRLYI